MHCHHSLTVLTNHKQVVCSLHATQWMQHADTITQGTVPLSQCLKRLALTNSFCMPVRNSWLCAAAKHMVERKNDSQTCNSGRNVICKHGKCIRPR